MAAPLAIGLIEPIWHGGTATTERGPSGTGDKNPATDKCEEFRTRAGGAAASAFIYPPRHHYRRRLCVAEGCQMAGSAARPVGAKRGYPQISRSGKRLYRKPARP